jgi:soluble lytic murein transglycosylase-like protein
VKFGIVQWTPCLSAWLAFNLAGLLAAPAQAQVMDIRPDGTMATYRGPVIVSAGGVQPLAPKNNNASSMPPVAAAISTAAARHAVSGALIEAVAWQESHMQQAAVSPKGARGVMQLMPGTAQALGVNPAELTGNVDGGAAYLAAMLARFDGDIIKALAAYNAGPEAVQRYAGVPPYAETHNYVNAVLDRMASSGVQP